MGLRILDEFLDFFEVETGRTFIEGIDDDINLGLVFDIFMHADFDELVESMSRILEMVVVDEVELGHLGKELSQVKKIICGVHLFILLDGDSRKRGYVDGEKELAIQLKIQSDGLQKLFGSLFNGFSRNLIHVVFCLMFDDDTKKILVFFNFY